MTRQTPSWGVVLAAFTLGSLGVAATGQELPPQRTADLRGEVANQQGEPVAGARCTLTGALLASPGISVTTNAKGQFTMPGLVPGSYTLTCAAMGYRPVVQEGIEMAGEPISVQVVLPPATVLRQTIEVRATPSPVNQESTSPPATLTSQQLFTLPLTEQKFEAALPLVPGVVRTPDGRIDRKSTRLNSSHLVISYAVFCLKKKKKKMNT